MAPKTKPTYIAGFSFEAYRHMVSFLDTPTVCHLVTTSKGNREAIQKIAEQSLKQTCDPQVSHVPIPASLSEAETSADALLSLESLLLKQGIFPSVLQQYRSSQPSSAPEEGRVTDYQRWMRGCVFNDLTDISCSTLKSSVERINASIQEGNRLDFTGIPGGHEAITQRLEESPGLFMPQEVAEFCQNCELLIKLVLDEIAYKRFAHEQICGSLTSPLQQSTQVQGVPETFIKNLKHDRAQLLMHYTKNTEQQTEHEIANAADILSREQLDSWLALSSEAFCDLFACTAFEEPTLRKFFLFFSPPLPRQWPDAQELTLIASYLQQPIRRYADRVKKKDQQSLVLWESILTKNSSTLNAIAHSYGLYGVDWKDIFDDLMQARRWDLCLDLLSHPNILYSLPPENIDRAIQEFFHPSRLPRFSPDRLLPLLQSRLSNVAPRQYHYAAPYLFPLLFLRRNLSNQQILWLIKIAKEGFQELSLSLILNALARNGNDFSFLEILNINDRCKIDWYRVPSTSTPDLATPFFQQNYPLLWERLCQYPEQAAELLAHPSLMALPQEQLPPLEEIAEPLQRRLAGLEIPDASPQTFRWLAENKDLLDQMSQLPAPAPHTPHAFLDLWSILSARKGNPLRTIGWDELSQQPKIREELIPFLNQNNRDFFAQRLFRRPEHHSIDQWAQKILSYTTDRSFAHFLWGEIRGDERYPNLYTPRLERLSLAFRLNLHCSDPQVAAGFLGAMSKLDWLAGCLGQLWSKISRLFAH